MLAALFHRFVTRLPAVRLERELAVAREANRALEAQLEVSEAFRREGDRQLAELRRRYDKLVEARLLKDQAIAIPLSDPPAKTAPVPALFGNIGLTRVPRPADADDDHAPAGASMTP